MDKSGEKSNNLNKLNKNDVLKEANRCLNCSFAPCKKKCPLGVNIPEFIDRVKNQDIKKAFEVISKDSYFPLICSRICPKETQCEGACIRGKKGKPVSIGTIEHFVASVFNNFDNEKSSFPSSEYSHKIDNSKKIAVVGSGPAGLSCAVFLRRLGYNVTIFERMSEIGGMLFYGVPEFRFKKSILKNEITKLKMMGIDIKNKIEIGKDLFLKDLLNNKKFCAIFLATGTWMPKKLNIPGENLKGVYNFIDFLLFFNNQNNKVLKPAKNIAVVGGGSVAIDIARCAKKIKNISNVYLIYRRSINEILANEKDIKDAVNEDIKFEMLTNVKEIIGDSLGNVKKIVCTKNKMLEKLDKSGRPIFSEISDTEFAINTDIFIVCVGSNASTLPEKDPHKKILYQNTNAIKVKENFQSIAIPQIFVGGDLVLGPSTAAKAMANGKKVAENIHRYLTESISL